MKFRVDQIDHVELTVPDRYLAANWYHKVLGLQIISEFEFWADDPQGPLMIGTMDTGTKLALFTGVTTGPQDRKGIYRIAFRVQTEQFVNFARQLDKLKLRDDNNQIVNREMIVDHSRAFSIYFCDPYGNRLELTTYDYDSTKSALSQIMKARNENEQD